MAGLRTPSEDPEGAERRREAQGQPAARCGQPGISCEKELLGIYS